MHRGRRIHRVLTLHLGRNWKLVRLVRSPSPQTLPTVLTRDEVKRLFRVIREERFRVILRLIYTSRRCRAISAGNWE